MLRGKDVRLWPLDDRREQLRKIIQTLPDTIRYSETFDVPLSELMTAVKKHQVEGISRQAGQEPVPLRRTFRGLVKVAG